MPVGALDRALAFTRHDDVDVVNAAATAIGHFARLHHDLNLKAAIDRMRELQKDERTALRAKYALEDIQTFRR